MKVLFAITCITLLSTFTGAVQMSQTAARTRLRMELFRNYTGDTTTDNGLNISVSASLVSLSDHEGGELLEFLLTAQYFDERLKWMPTAYEGITILDILATGNVSS